MAVVFVSRVEEGKTIKEGLCIKCAREMGFNPVNDLFQNLGLDQDAMDEMNEQLTELLNGAEADQDFSEGGAPSVDLSADGLAKSEETPGKEKKQKRERSRQSDDGRLKYLPQFCQNLTQKARENKIDNIVGRETEMQRVMQILNRRTKNNPCLIGEPGVGKTAIAEGVALRIAQGKAPAKIAMKEIYLLDLTALIAGTQFRGQFESRVKGLIEEVKRVGNIILVIDEVHNLVGTGDSEGTMSAANMLKPALSRGEIQVIGATTLKEYRKYIEKDAALERRFQPVIVDEPSIAETVEMIRGIKGYYEKFHNIKIPMLVAEKAVEMSERYVTDRFLPDKAIDLIDEAASNAVLRNPAYEQLFLKGRDLAEAKDELAALGAIAEPTNDDFMAIAKARAAECKLSEEVAALQDQIKDCAVTYDDLATVVQLWTGIPAAKIQESENSKLNNLEANLKKYIVGQDKAVAAVAAAVKRGRVGLVPRHRPISFIFTGPTGVGKTELVKVLSRELFDSPETLIRLDMSEFMEKHSVSRIIGAPPGYVGYDEAGQLTEKIRRKPYSVILFDEIEKAHPDVMNILLQVLDDGRITDAQGRTVNFENTLIVMTSNAGSNIRGSAAGFTKSSAEASEEKTKKALSEFLRPEFLNRVDEIITFDPLPKSVFGDIVRIRLRELEDGLRQREIALEYDDGVVDILAEKSYSAEYGARNVRRVIQKQIEDKAVAQMCASDSVPSKVILSSENGEISVSIN